MKKMRYLLVSTLLVGLTITGCGETKESPAASTPAESTPAESTPAQSTPADSTPDTSTPAETNLVITAVNFEGLEDIEAHQGDAINPKTGVKVTATYTADGKEQSFILTSYVTVTQGSETLSTKCNTQEVGEFTLKYKVNTEAVVGFTFKDGIELEATRKLTVTEVQVSADELIVNGDFAEGQKGWDNYLESDATFTYTDGQFKVVENSVPNNAYGVRLNTASGSDFSLFYGTTYLVSLDLWADQARTVQVQLGTLLPSAPYWIEMYDENNKGLCHQFDITTTKTTYTWMFTLSSSTSEQVDLTLEMGGLIDNKEQPATTIYADNISVKAAVDDGVDRLPPKIDGADNVRVQGAASGTFDVLAGVSGSDTNDGDVTSGITYVIKNEAGEEINEISLAQPGNYVVVYSVSDAAGNKTEVTRKVKVVASGSSKTYEPALSVEKADLGFGEEAHLTPDTLVYWNDQNWCGQQVTVDHAYSQDKKVYVGYASTGAAQWGAGFQLFYKNSDLLEGNEYTLSLTIQSDVAGKVRVNGQEVDLVVGENQVSVKYTEGGAANASFAFINGVYADGNPSTVDGNFVLSNIKWSEGSAEPEAIKPVLSVEKADLGFGEEAHLTPDTLVYWNDQNWCGQQVTVDHAYSQDNKVYVGYTSTGVAQWGAGFQLFYKSSDLVEGNEYTLSLTIQSDVAGKVRVNGQEVDLVVGENQVSVKYTEGGAANASFAFINGVYADGNPSTVDGNFVLSNIKWSEGSAEPEGMTPVLSVEKADLGFGEEAHLTPDTLVYWNDQNWCGQQVTVDHAYSQDNKVYVGYTSTGAAQWGAGFQLFYKNSELMEGSKYTLSLTIQSDVAGKVRVNGQEVDLVVGENQVSVQYTEGGAANASFAFINGVYADGNPSTVDGNFVLSNIKWSE